MKVCRMGQACISSQMSKISQVSQGRKGKVLSVRIGYNANSSSLGAVVTYIMFGAAAIQVVINMFASVKMARQNEMTMMEENNANT